MTVHQHVAPQDQRARDLMKAPSGVVTVALLPSLMRDLAGDLFSEVRRLWCYLPRPTACAWPWTTRPAACGVSLRVIFEADSLQAQKEIIARERCFAVLSPQTVGKEVAQGLLEARQIVNPELPRLVVMSTTTQRPLSRAAREVSRVIRRLMADAEVGVARSV